MSLVSNTLLYYSFVFNTAKKLQICLLIPISRYPALTNNREPPLESKTRTTGGFLLLFLPEKLVYYYMRNFCNLIGLEQWNFSLI